MLSIDARKNLDAYNRVGCFLNIAWLAGYLRGYEAGGREFFVQQSEDENLNVPVEMPDGETLPSRFQERSPITVIGHVSGRRVDGEQVAVLRAVGLDYANVIEIDPSIVLARLRRRANPGAASADAQFQPFRVSRDDFGGGANRVRLAGIIASMSLRERTATDSARLLLMLRQREADDADVPVRFYGGLAAKVAEMVDVGYPVQIAGSLFVDAKRSVRSEADGQLVVIKRPFVLSKTVPMLVDEKVMTDVPQWADRLMEVAQAAAEHRRDRASPPGMPGAL